MSKNTDDIDYASFDSYITVRIRATKREHIGYVGSGPDEYPDHGHKEMAFETEGTLVFENHLASSMVNIDCYLSPPADWLGDYPNEIEEDDYQITSPYAKVDVVFTLYEDEIRKAAQQRASEDCSHEVRVLASWLWQAGGADHVSRTDAMSFYNALRNALEATGDDAPDWALCYDGTPRSTWRRHNDEDPVTTLDEAKHYVYGGFDRVLDRRGDDDE